MPSDAEALSIPSKLKPLVVDLDGTLVRSDLLAKSAFAHLGHDPLAVVGLLSALLRGKAALKAEIAAKTVLDVTQLPYDDAVVSIIRKARAAGNPVYLASASNERYVRAVADHLGLFDGCFASTDNENCLLLLRRAVWWRFSERRVLTTSAMNAPISPCGLSPIDAPRCGRHLR